MPNDHRSVVAGKTYRLDITAAERSELMDAIFFAIASDRELARTAKDTRDRELAMQSIARLEGLQAKLVELRRQGAPTQITEGI